MNFTNAENSRNYLVEFLGKSKSPSGRLLFLNHYFNLFIDMDDHAIKEIYIKEFIEVYLFQISRIDLLSLDYIYYEEILNTINKLKEFTFLSDKIDDFNFAIQLLENKLTKTKALLENNQYLVNSKIKFPVLEIPKDETPESSYGLLESITVNIKPIKQKTKFVIIPSDKEIDSVLKEQLNLSFDYALKYISTKKKKISKNYEIKISFENILGHYEGNSLGTVLTILFIEQLLLVNNTAEIVKTTNNLALTGGHAPDGNLLACGKKIIQKKVETAFYADIQTFIIPKDDEQAALERLSELNKKYPKRVLDIISIKNINDLFNRRDLIDIRKQNPIVRTVKILKKSRVAYLTILILLILIGYIFYREIDNNPAIWVSESKNILIKNKSGKLLWSVDYNEKITGESSSQLIRFIDINQDNNNEIIYADKLSRYIRCLNKNKDTIWSYKFCDRVETRNGKIDTFYSFPYIIDTLTISKKTCLVLFSQNSLSFSSPIFFIDIKYGKRIGTTFWNQGHIQGGIIKDYDLDGKNEIIFVGSNNSYLKKFLGVIEIDKLYGQAPCTSTDNYKLLNIPDADIEQYILFPRSDYNIFLNKGMNGIHGNVFNLAEQDKEFRAVLYEDRDDMSTHIGYYFSLDFKYINVNITDGLRNARDPLVKKGILKPPYTDTQEYCEILRGQFQYWTGEKFISRKEWIEHQRLYK